MWTRRKPTIFLDIPRDQRRSDPEEITQTIAVNLQSTVHSAIQLH
ncbi:MAG: hypothetical protein AAB436_03000 [Patescibacteria group bacterium]